MSKTAAPLFRVNYMVTSPDGRVLRHWTGNFVDACKTARNAECKTLREVRWEFDLRKLPDAVIRVQAALLLTREEYDRQESEQLASDLRRVNR